MVALLDRMYLSQQQRVELDEEGVMWIMQAFVPGVQPAQEVKLDAAGAAQLCDFLLLYQEQLERLRDGYTP